MSDAKTIPFHQGSAPMPQGCVCSPMDYAALGHMTTCPCYVPKTLKIMNSSLYGAFRS
jgi:hypothetical protein